MVGRVPGNVLNNLEMYKNRPNKFWKELRSIVSKEQPAEVFSLNNEESGETYEGVISCDYINKYFSHIGANLADSIKMKHGD